MNTSLQTNLRKPRNDEIDVFGLTHTGRVRIENQDHFLIGLLGVGVTPLLTSLPALPEYDVLSNVPDAERVGLLAMVADGVGGNVQGGEASRLAVEAVTLYVARSMKVYYDSANDDAAFLGALEQAAEQTHAEIVQRGAGDSHRKGMATTLTLFLGVWPRIYLLQVGDSRYYQYSDGKLTQISRDQTIAQELIDQGVLTPERAKQTRWSNVLSSALGGSTSTPKITRLENDWSRVHLLCSDGLTKHVSDEQIRDRLATMTSAREACEALLEDALAGGGTDNITVIVGRAVARPDSP
jgi:serine/threonine protein phosphatase PrpC